MTTFETWSMYVLISLAYGLLAKKRGDALVVHVVITTLLCFAIRWILQRL